MWDPRESYVVKFALALLVIVAIIFVFGISLQGDVEGTLEKDVERQLTQEVSADADKINEWLEGNERSTLTVSNHPALADSSQWAEYIRQVNETQLRDQAVGVHLVSVLNRTIVESTNPARVGTNIRDTTWGPQLGTASREKIATTDPFTNPDGRTVVVSGRVAPQSPQGTNLLFLVEYDASDLSEEFSAGIDGTFTEIVGPEVDNTKVLFSDYPDGNRELESYTPDGRSASEITEMNNSENVDVGFRSDSTYGQTHDGDYIAAYTAIEGTEWVMIKHAPADNAFAISNDVQRGIYIFVGIALVGVLLVGGAIGRNTAVAIRDLSDKAETLESGDLDIEIESSRKDEIGQLYSTFDTMRKALKQQIEEARTARKEAEVAREEAEQQREILQEAADNYKEVMSKCADGDLTQRLEPDERNDAMRQIAAEFNNMINQIEGTVAQVKQFSSEVTDTSEIVLESTSELKDASGQIAESAQIITDETEELQEDLDAVSHQLEQSIDRLEAGETDAAIDELADIAESLSALAERVSESLNESENIAAATEQQTAALSEVTETARSLDRSAGPLDDLLNKFENSDDQTFYFGEASGATRKTSDEDDEDSESE